MDKRKRIHRWRAILSAILIVIVLAGCSSQSKDAANSVSGGSGASSNSAAPSNGGSAAVLADSGYEVKSSVQLTAASGDDAASATVEPGMGSMGAGFYRKMIYNANVVMRVDDYDAVQSKIYDLIHLSGAYIVRFSDHQSTREKGGTFVIKVPAEGFHSFLDRLDELTDRPLQRSINGQDVTEEYVDLESRLKAKQVVEARLLSFMEKATAAGDLVAFSNELARVQEEIEMIKGRMRYLDQNVAYSTVELRVVESDAGRGDKDDKPAYERAVDALLASMKGLERFFESLLVFVAAALPIVLVMSVPGMALLVLYRRSANNAALKRRKQEEKSEAKPDDEPPVPDEKH